MFSNNPLYVERLVELKQEDILREIPSHRADEFLDAGSPSPGQKARSRIWVPLGLLMALAWLFLGVF